LVKPSLGRIVLLRLDDQLVKQMGSVQYDRIAPAMIVKVWSDTCVNLKVLGDGPENLWVTSATLGDAERQWHWPPQVQQYHPVLPVSQESLVPDEAAPGYYPPIL